LRDQHQEERDEYLEDIREGIEAVATSVMNEDGSREYQVSGEAALGVIGEVDPKKHLRHREDYVKRGFGLYLKKKKPKEELPPPTKGKRGAKPPPPVPVKKESPKPKKPEKLDFSRTIDVEDFMKNLGSNVVVTSTKRDVLNNFKNLAGGENEA